MESIRVTDKSETGGLEGLFRELAGSAVLAAAGGMAPGDSGSAVAVAGEMASGLLEGRTEVLVHEGEGGPDGVLGWSRLPWDTSITGVRCARIQMLGGAGCGDLVEAWRVRADGEGIEYTTARVPEGNPWQASQEQALESAGFTQLEEIIYLSAPTRRGEGPVPGVEEAGTGDMEEIRRIARKAYTFDRFHGDPVFTGEAAARVHEEWARGSFAGRADTVLCVRGPERWPVGYCTVILPRMEGSKAGWIDMLAVSPSERGKGKGISLVLAALAWLDSRGVPKAALCTQAGNSPALALYSRTGFSEYSRAVTWRRDARDR